MWGLRNTDIEQLNDIFQKRTEIEEAIIFGSRAIGRHKPGSDVDIALKGSRLTTGILSALREQLNEETDMPYRFDLFLYSEIHSPDLLIIVLGQAQGFTVRSVCF
ncbi:MAG: nucleotidyltransferase domain-containing protein [Saprospiraceae bacterium]|nr:nucleotidyltransferase domain-containing protein [Saprospiraceae bacterium]